MAKQSRTKSALGGKKKSKGSPRVPEAVKKYIDKEIKKQVHRMHISKTANGKFLVDHEFKAAPGETPVESEQYAVEPGDLSTHVGENLGIGGSVAPETALPPASLPTMPTAPPGAPAPPGATPTEAAPILPPAGPLGV